MREHRGVGEGAAGDGDRIGNGLINHDGAVEGTARDGRRAFLDLMDVDSAVEGAAGDGKLSAVELAAVAVAVHCAEIAAGVEFAAGDGRLVPVENDVLGDVLEGSCSNLEDSSVVVLDGVDAAGEVTAVDCQLGVGRIGALYITFPGVGTGIFDVSVLYEA